MKSVKSRYVVRSGGYSTNGKGYGNHVAISSSNNGARYPYNVIEIPSSNEGVHPTQKPVALLEYLVLTYTNPGDTVLDCTMGSGTTGVACRETGRKFIGIEEEPEYYEIARRRIEAAHDAG
jgi:site-specific DNA-methyltransferase (adenine-specific)